MTALPVIVGFGGVNAAGRSAFHHGYRRMVSSALPHQIMQPTWQSLAQMMGVRTAAAPSADDIALLKAGTLVRRIEANHFDVDAVLQQQKATIPNNESVVLELRRVHLPRQLPAHWTILDECADSGFVRIKMNGADASVLLPCYQPYPVSSAGQLPHGFDAAKLYRSQHHPRALSNAIYGASDAIQSMGIPWAEILQTLRPDQVSVYAGSSLGQLDQWGLGGLYQNPLTGGRASSKMIALSMAQMTADFINGYMIGSVGATGAAVGACATFLYNLRQGVIDIQTGRAKVVIVGNTEAPLVPAIMEGFQVMGALSTDADLMRLDGTQQPDHRRACRPFSTNAGFVMAESAQFLILMDDALALDLGASIYGSVPDVFVNADAYKKSISAPGIGNSITVAKAAAMFEHLLGRHGLAETFVQAHGTGTPQNRVTESAILNQVARHFGISAWPVTAVKSYVGHSLGPAAGDQIMSALGVWSEGIVPAIATIDHIADDVHQTNLNILQQHLPLDQPASIQGCLINSKGFGGNNSSAPLLSPISTLRLLKQRYGQAHLTQYHHRNEGIQRAQQAYDHGVVLSGVPIIYNFGQSVITPEQLEFEGLHCALPNFSQAIDLSVFTQYTDLLPDPQ